MNAYGLINDGLFEFMYIGRRVNSFKALYHFMKPGGRMIHDPDFTIYRCKSVRINNKTVDAAGKVLDQDINIDGEDFIFNNYVKYRMLPS